MLTALQQRHGGARLREALGHLEADETAAYDDGSLHARRGDVVFHPERVLNGAQSKNALVVYARHIGHGGLRARREQQLVIALGVLAAGLRLADGDRLGLRVYRDDLAVHAHVDVEPRLEAPGRLERQRPLVGDIAADVIRQPAVGIGHIPAALKNDDLGALVYAAEPRRGSRAAGDAADYNHFHIHAPFGVFTLPTL